MEQPSCGNASSSPPRPFRSKVLEELTRSNDLSNDLTPHMCFQVLKALLPSTLVATMVDEMNQFIYKRPHDDNNRSNSGVHLLAHKDLYVGLLAHVEDKKQQLVDLRQKLASKQHQNVELAVEIAMYQDKLEQHYTTFDEQAALNAIATLKHRRVLRERQCTGLMKTIDEKQDRLLEQEKAIKAELDRLRMDDCAYRLNAKKLKENQQLLESMNTQKRPDMNAPSETDLKCQIKALQEDIASKHPKLHDLSTQIFAVRLQAVEGKCEEIQAKVAAYQRSHTPRPNWDALRGDVEYTFQCHNLAGDANISTEALMKMQSSAHRVEYLAAAIELIGLSQDTASRLLSVHACAAFLVVFMGYIVFSSLLHVIFYRRGPVHVRSVHHGSLISFNLIMAAAYAMVSTELHVRGLSLMQFDAVWPSWLAITGQVVGAMLGANHVEYYWHRLLHSRFLYTRVHKVHHHYKHPHPFDDMYMHPVEGAAFFFILYGPPFVLPMHVVSFVLYMMVMGLFGVLDHSGVPFHLPYVYSSTDHATHHTKVNSNFGFPFPYWDLVHGTYDGDFGA
ncbi:hypothetical protein DYB31_007277 [Aphanomyces astaci]|uniref:Fatty acid hydroxylase domain-containing protein n=1 Tax=Aphanomyces astaci TaxID=112090 RepID=A0A397EUF5_APHAT|nr:hypothetical protein DYB31_007277 [Aphanomyces astaci]